MALNTTEEAEDYYYEDVWLIPEGLSVFGGVWMIILIVMAVFGNLMVIISYFRDKQLQTVHNMYILNLAVTDFFIGAVSMSFYADFTLSPWIWHFGRVFCKIWCLVDYVLCFESILLTLLLSLDRVILLKKGAEYLVKETKRRALAKIVVSWSLSFVIYTPCVMLWELIKGYSVIEDEDCNPEFFDDFGYNTAAGFFEMIIPCGALIVLNSMVFLEIRKRRKIFDQGHVSQLRSVSSGVDFSKLKENGVKQINIEHVSSSKDKSNMKAAKFLAVLVVAFLITWVPYSLSLIIANLCTDCVNHHLLESFTWLLWAKSSINPFLYAWQSRRFRDNFNKLPPFSLISRGRHIFKRRTK